MGEPMLCRSITFTNGVISLDQDQTTCTPKLIIWPPSICYLVSRPKKVNERMLAMMALIGCLVILRTLGKVGPMLSGETRI